MEKIKSYQKPAANDDFFHDPQPFYSRLVPVSPTEPVEQSPISEFLFLEAA